MKNKKLQTVIIVLVIVAAVGATRAFVFPQSPTGQFTNQKEVIVTRVVDGDTIVVEGGDRIRLLDIDTPEKGQMCYKEATNRLAELIFNKPVILKKVNEDHDQYGRLLRYVYYNNTNINLLMVKEGFAHLYFYNKNTPYYSQLIEAEQAAKKGGLCVWKTQS